MSERRARLGTDDLGVGVGLRVPHYSHIFREQPAVEFFEVISENFMAAGGRPRYHLEKLLEQYRVVQHGVSLGIGGPEPLDRAYLRKLRELTRRTRTPWVSDHFCWSSASGVHLHDLLPLPYTRETVARLVERARHVQDYLELPLLLENTSSYLTYRSSVLSEWEFVSEVAERANIGLLLDVNNVWVSAYNHGFDPVTFVERVPHDRIAQIHLASHTNVGSHIIDTHRGRVPDPVLDLYRLAIEHAGSVSTIIEWDDDIPSFPVLLSEAARAAAARDDALDARRLGTSSVDPGNIRAALREAREAPASDRVAWHQGGRRELAGDAGEAAR